MSKIVIFGASGMIGQRVLREALDRGHQVTAVARDTTKIISSADGLTVAAGDVTDPSIVAELSTGADVVVSAIAPPRAADADPKGALLAAADGLIDGLSPIGEDAPLLIVVGGAGSLETSPGVRLVDAPDFGELYKPEALAQAAVLAHFRTVVDLAWTVISPPATIAPGTRTGKFRVGDNELITDAEGISTISAEDFAVAIVNEAEKPAHVGHRFTVGY